MRLISLILRVLPLLTEKLGDTGNTSSIVYGHSVNSFRLL
jgi:hypothetical protein